MKIFFAADIVSTPVYVEIRNIQLNLQTYLKTLAFMSCSPCYSTIRPLTVPNMGTTEVSTIAFRFCDRCSDVQDPFIAPSSMTREWQHVLGDDGAKMAEDQR